MLLADAGRLLVDGPTRAQRRQLHDLAVGVLDVDGLEVMAVQDPVDGVALVEEAALPAEEHVAVGDREREVMAAADAGLPLRRGGALHDGEEAARPRRGVAEPARGTLPRPADRAGPSPPPAPAQPRLRQPENAPVEVGRAPEVAAHEGDVVQAGRRRCGQRSHGPPFISAHGQRGSGTSPMRSLSPLRPNCRPSRKSYCTSR